MNSENFRKLKELNLKTMSEEYKRQCNVENIEEYTFEQRLTLLLDSECDSRFNNKINRLIKEAKFLESNASITQIRYYEDRKLDKKLINGLASNNYIVRRTNIVIAGKTGSGKTYLANALGVNACLNSISTKYIRLPDLFNEIEYAKIQGNQTKLIEKYAKYTLLIIDEWLLIPIKISEQRVLLEIMERRHRNGSTILCSQFSTESWYKKFDGGGPLVESILDRILSNSISLLIDGKISMRDRENNLD